MQQTNIPSQKKFNWKLFFVLWAATVLGLIAVIPYTLTLQSEQLARVQLPMSLELLILLQVSTNAIFFGVLTGLGLFIANKYGLGLPFVEKIINKEKIESSFKQPLVLAVTTGIFVAMIISVLDLWIFNLDNYLLQFGIEIPESVHPAPWQGFLASFYGGITEEVLLRLFLLTLIVWLGMLITRNKTNNPSLALLWIANIIAAIIFGLGHLPATAAVGAPLDFFVVTRAIVLNGIGGIAFGWLYFRKGLESAMIAHFSADIVLHVIF